MTTATHMQIAELPDRAVVGVEGPDAESLLQGLVTNDLGRLAGQDAIHAGLLTPQGKILFAFMIVKTAGGFMLETAADSATDLVKRLTFYRLRAKATIRDLSDSYRVAAAWGGNPPVPQDSVAYRDPRHAGLGWRMLLEAGTAEEGLEACAATGCTRVDATAYHAHRIACGVPEIGHDYAPSDVFPHEAQFDSYGGVDFKKGCFVGQEVVSRMQHKTVARKRIVPVEGTAPLPPDRPDIIAGPATIGRVGSVAGTSGLAMVRLDRAVEAREAGTQLTAGDVPVSVASDALDGYARAAAAKAKDA